jgi:hypothetical protein
MKSENIKVSCSLISESVRRIKNELSMYKNLPVELYIAINTAQRIIEKENHKIRRAIWRKKYYRPTEIKPTKFIWSATTNTGSRYVNS